MPFVKKNKPAVPEGSVYGGADEQTTPTPQAPTPVQAPEKKKETLESFVGMKEFEVVGGVWSENYEKGTKLNLTYDQSYKRVENGDLKLVE